MQVSLSFSSALKKKQGYKVQEQQTWLSSLPMYSEFVLLTRECLSVFSLVSASIWPDMVARALDAINGVMSLTKAIEPMMFGTLLTMS